MSRGFTGTNSLKVKALAAVFGRPWQGVALDWCRMPLTQREVAEKWTTVVSVLRPDVRFSDKDVSDIFRLARACANASDTETSAEICLDERDSATQCAGARA